MNPDSHDGLTVAAWKHLKGQTAPGDNVTNSYLALGGGWFDSHQCTGILEAMGCP